MSPRPVPHIPSLAMYTGQYVHTTRHRSLDHLLQDREPNMFGALKENDVHVAYLGPRGDTFAMGVTEKAVHERGWVVSKHSDVTSTLYDIFGIKEEYSHSGKALLPVMADPSVVHKQYADSDGGFLLREEPLLEYAPFPDDKKTGIQHEKPAVVGRAVAIRDQEWTNIYSLYEAG